MELPSNQILKAERLKTERSALRKYLKRGDLVNIAQLAEVSVQIVYRWFRGEIENSPVGTYIEHLAEVRKKAMEKNIHDKM